MVTPLGNLLAPAPTVTLSVRSRFSNTSMAVAAEGIFTVA